MSCEKEIDPVLPRFREFIEHFCELQDNDKLFPKQCRSCGEEFSSFSEYLCLTSPKGHVLEDCTKIMKRPYTMVYRHCPCGNTLVLALTLETFPRLDEFWRMLGELSDQLGVPLVDVVSLFVKQCDRHILQKNPCLGNPSSAG